ncbi:glycosyltransferase family 4 protein [Patescibacteria group bacterium]|nr:glycosyltransferase family 4 protein [Patescibacteria group bacterium]
MKIGIDARFWDESGVGRYTRNLVEQLQEIDKTNEYVLFVSSKVYQEIKNQTLPAGRQESKIKNNKNWKLVETAIHWHSIGEQFKFPQIINRENLDLMHFPYFSVPVFYHKPFVVTIHDLILHHFATGEATTRSRLVYYLKLLGYKFIIKTSARNAKKIITVSKATKVEVIKHLHVPEEKITVIYEGAFSPPQPPLIRGGVQTSPPEKGELEGVLLDYLLHVGNLYPHKNMDLLLKTFMKIKDGENLPVQLIIAGKEDYFYYKFQKKVKELGLQNQILFMGEISDSKLQYLYQNALALISTSLMEGFDLPTIEAMNNNCLVLASDIPVHREICENIAIYFDPEKEEDLISKIKEVCSNGKEKYKEKIENGKSRASKFNWQQMAKETMKVYEEILNIT